MPGMTGIQMHDQLSTLDIHIPTIFITGYPGVPPRVSAGTPKPVAFFRKPFDCAELIACIESVLARSA
ncbi:CheY [Pseudomonas ogarae]|nr:CheY [Pseudomonas ogarae]